MFIKSFIFLFGFGLTVISLSFIIIYLNLLTIGYTFIDYLRFISKRIECLNILLGILLMSTFFIGGKHELYL